MPEALRVSMDLERYNLYRPERFRHDSATPAFDMRFAPQNCGPFILPCFWINRRHFYTYDANSYTANDRGIFSISKDCEEILYPIHPAELSHYADFLSKVNARSAASDGLTIWAIPTSSIRTLLIWPDGQVNKALFVKLSLQSRTFGARQISRSKVARSVGISLLLRNDHKTLPRNILFLYEATGIAPRSMPHGGVLYRTLPNEAKSGRIILAPMFSLIGSSDRHPPLLFTVLNKTGMNIRDFVEEIVCAGFARSWVEMSLRNGVLLEAHGQNLLLSLSRTFEPLGWFYYRDFQDLMVDWDLRRATGYPTPEHMPNAWSWNETYDSGYFRGIGVSWYLQVSIKHFMQFILGDMESAVRDWRRQGLRQTPHFESDEFIMMFSRQVLKAVYDISGMRPAVELNIYRSLPRFAHFLMRVRRDMLERQSSDRRERVTASAS